MNDVVMFKVVSIISIWVIGITGGILPFFVEKFNHRVMGLLNCFSGGVFLAGGFLHLLHAAVTNPALKKWSEMDGGKFDFPWAEMFCTIGFLAVFSVEQLAHSFQLPAAKKQPSIDDQEPFLGTATVDIEMTTRTSRSKSHDHHQIQTDGSPAVAFVLFVALSFHSIMEGLGIGAQNESAWGIFLAIIVHKGLAAFALGSGLLRSNVSREKFVLYMFVFSMMSIVGIIVGWIISSESVDDSASAGICLALASGTFIYVAVMEVIPHEFAHRHNTGSKMAALVMGYAIFGTLAKWS